jgi:ribonuclease P protein component
LKPHRFPKSERLHSKKIIDSLFNPANKSLGGNVFLYPFKIFWLKIAPIENNPSDLLPQIIVSIPKKNFKKAVERNRLRRQIKEIYRLNRLEIFSKQTTPLALGIVYIAKEKNEFVFMRKKLIVILHKVVEAIKESPKG